MTNKKYFSIFGLLVVTLLFGGSMDGLAQTSGYTTFGSGVNTYLVLTGSTPFSNCATQVDGTLDPIARHEDGTLILDSAGRMTFNSNPWAAYFVANTNNTDAQTLNQALISGEAHMYFARDWLQANVPLCATSPRAGAPAFAPLYTAWLASRNSTNPNAFTPPTPTQSTGQVSGYSSAAVQALINSIQQTLTTLTTTATNLQNNDSSGGIIVTPPGGGGATNCTITVNASVLNVRSAASITSTVVRQMSAGQTFTATGSVTGDMVEGSNKWWRVSDGNFIWAGGTTGGSSCGGGTGTGGNGGPGTGVGTGQPSNSPSVTPPTAPTASACTLVSNPNIAGIDCGSVDYAISMVRSLPGMIYSFGDGSSSAISIGNINAWVNQYRPAELPNFPNGISDYPAVKAEIEFVVQKIAWFKQLYGNASVLLLEGAVPPFGGTRPIALYNRNTRSYLWMVGFSPADIYTKAGTMDWSLKDLFLQTKNSPPSQVNSNSQVAVMMGLTEENPASGTIKVSHIGPSYRFNGTVWTKI